MHHNTALPIPDFDRRSPLAILPASFISLHLLEPLDDTLILVLTQTEGHRIQTHIHTDPRIVRISEWEGGGVSLQFDLWTDWGKDVVMFLERKSKYWKVLRMEWSATCSFYKIILKSQYTYVSKGVSNYQIYDETYLK